jgi:superfamily I DNA and/or RNA helicase
LNETDIIISTCGFAGNKKLWGFEFKRVIIDEATQAQEIELLAALNNASQVTLVGDEKQLGPIYCNEVPENDSLFTRLIHSGYPHSVQLNTCFRMHRFLLNGPNELFYDNKILSKYKQDFFIRFIDKTKPFVFINCDIKEERIGTSYVNIGEARIVRKLMEYFISKGLDKDKFGFVSPYDSQIERLR